MSDFDKGWNAAIEAASAALRSAPLFPKKGRGAIDDAERINLISVCQREVMNLRRVDEQKAFKPCGWCGEIHDGACSRLISGGQSD